MGRRLLISFDERDTARLGISNLTGVTQVCPESGHPVNPSIMSEAGDGTVELLAPVLSCHFRTTWSAMLHGEPAWLFGAVHSPDFY